MNVNHLEIEAFASPPPQYRPMPFWGINDRLDADLIASQIDAMHAAGWGGFFPHPRYGLETPYLGEDYFAKMEIAADRAASKSLEFWIYDEFPFPAGAAGGVVGAANREFRHRVLVMNVHNCLIPMAEGIAYFSVSRDATERLSQFERIDPADDSDAEWFVHFYEWEMPAAPTRLPSQVNNFIHGFPYIDTLNSDAVDRFIEVTYDAYDAVLGRHFGSTVKGAFSDIPVYQWHYATPRPSIPWTAQLANRFESRFGYSLIESLPSLFFALPGYEQVRHDFWRCVSDEFLRSYTQRLAAWCRRKGIAYSAHYWGEETLSWQVAWTGDVMAHFAEQDVVANDHILRDIADPLGIKQAASVAEQLGKPRVLTETYALSGHNLSFQERKWIADWEYALGSNMLVPYVPSYSLRGRRKRDEPPSLFVQQPYFGDESMLSDYCGRLSYALTRGQRVVDLLLLQPLSTVQSLFQPPMELPPSWRPGTDPFEGSGARANWYSEAFTDCATWLLQGTNDFHVGNEAILRAHGSVVDGNLDVGVMRYKAVVVPPSTTWDSSTHELLDEYVRQGGSVIAIRPTPEFTDGTRAATFGWLNCARQIDRSSEALQTAIDELVQPSIRVSAGPDVLYHHRVDGREQICFVSNTSLTAPAAVEVEFLRTAVGSSGRLRRIESWNPADGQRQLVVSAGTDEGRQVAAEIPPGGSLLLVATDADDPLHPMRDAVRGATVAVNESWMHEAAQPNALVLDYCDVRIEGQPLGRMPVWQAHEAVGRAGHAVDFTLDFSFTTAESYQGDLALAVERRDQFSVEVNGSRLPADLEASVWWDPSLAPVPIARNLVVPGVNTIRLTGRSDLDTELEPIFVLGDFATRSPDFHLEPKTPIQSGTDLIGGGFPFYCGRHRLRQQVQLPPHTGRVWVEFDAVAAITLRVNVNGQQAGVLAWEPWRIEVSDLVRVGENEIELELSTSLHNLLGPHHDQRGEARHFVIDRAWMDSANWTDDYFFVPVGVRGVRVRLEGVE